MDSNLLRSKFIEFFQNNGHRKIPESSLVPENDPTVLFTTAGMQPLASYLLGQKHALGNKLVNIQPCIRTADIDEIGDENHLTMFEMMGYWSLGSYWKKEAIELSFNFFVKELGLSIEKLGVTCFTGDEKKGISKDIESAEIWKRLGIKRIAFLSYKDNFWGPVGENGLCGPDSEIFYWNSAEDTPEDIDVTDSRWIEIGNDVFMEYNKINNNYEKLNQKNVDFGAGFERILAIVNKKTIFETNLFLPIIKKIEEISGKKYDDYKKEFRIISDHIKAATFAINDEVFPSNKDRGYIVRRLIRRAIIKASQIGIENNFTKILAEEVLKIYNGVYKFNNNILIEIEKEEEKFRKTIKIGLKQFEKISENNLDSQKLFDLYQTYGFPLELSQEIAKQKNILISQSTLADFNNLMRKHQDLSRTASAGMFKGGLAGSGEIETKYHTATHLLLASLRKVLGSDVNQKGANITTERIRFDFSYPEKLTDKQIEKVEDLVNENIKSDLEITMQEMNCNDALKAGVSSIPGFKYPEKVKVYTIGTDDPSVGSGRAISREICGGPHVKHTGELGVFKIIKEESSSSGIRRIKAILK